MTEHHPPTFADLDWDELWRNARARKTWAGSNAKDWDKKAPSFSSRNQSSPFVSQVLDLIPLTASSTVLDIGCGPGTLALPIADRVKSVTAVDYSSGMLSTLTDLASQAGIQNIRTVQASWEDEWQSLGIGQHDITLASRSLAVADLRDALQRLDRYASSFVFIVDRISPSPFDPEAFAAVGRSFDGGPDYIYVLNTLYTMGIHANVRIISLDREIRFTDLDDAMRAYGWMIKNMSAGEESALRRHLKAKSRPSDDGRIIIERGFTPRWACIWWSKTDQYSSHPAVTPKAARQG
jgi:SAM-dependent methyltransferase